MAKQWMRAQQDLFEKAPPGTRLGATERVKALKQLQVLLIEATMTEDEPEAGNDQDHA